MEKIARSIFPYLGLMLAWFQRLTTTWQACWLYLGPGTPGQELEYWDTISILQRFPTTSREA